MGAVVVLVVVDIVFVPVVIKFVLFKEVLISVVKGGDAVLVVNICENVSCW